LTRSGSATSCPGGTTTTDTTEPDRSPRPSASSTLVLLAALTLGLIAGGSEIANTSIGWHLASGAWILEHGAVPAADPFSFTAEGSEWIDHEWLFQLVLALVSRIGGPPLLVAFRAVLVALLAGLLLRIGVRSGLHPAAALGLAALCLYGARIRFFIRPELATLLIVPSVVWIFLHRESFRSRRWLLGVAAMMVAGANLHAGVLVAPPLLAGLLAAEWLRSRISSSDRRPSLASGLYGLAVAAAAPICNPYGWHLYGVPLDIARLVGLPHIPNPEWISPSPADVPALYVALGLAIILLAARERDPTRWVLLVMASALALRYVRNVGLFFALLPIAVAPALARLELAARPPRPRRAIAGALVVALLIASSIVLGPRYRPSFDFSDWLYPHRAWAFMEQQGLDEAVAYNDVRFGGFLIHSGFPPRQVFLDDRNEIHEPLLGEIYGLFQRSDQAGWRRMLDRYGVTVALLRYNQSFEVVSPQGQSLGRRGFSALWFPASSWALVFWDDTAMVLIRRDAASPELLARHEYFALRPDDLDHLRERLRDEPEIRGQVATELARALADQPDNERALSLSEYLLELQGGAAGR
jgi:hypothetical protein